MKKTILVIFLTTNLLLSKNLNTINFQWTALFPSLNLEYKFEKGKFGYNMLRFGLGRYNRSLLRSGCSDCELGYQIIPTLSIYKEKYIENIDDEIDIKNWKDERGFILIINNDNISIARVRTVLYIPKNKNYYYRLGGGYGFLFDSTSNPFPIIIPIFGFGIKL